MQDLRSPRDVRELNKMNVGIESSRILNLSVEPRFETSKDEIDVVGLLSVHAASRPA